MKKKNVLMILTFGILMFVGIQLRSMPAEAASNPAGNIFDISEGNIAISATGSAIVVTYGGSQSKEISGSDNITITGTTTAYGVTVNGVTANITLDNVDIQLSSDYACAFALTGGADVTLILKDGTGNKLKKRCIYCRAAEQCRTDSYNQWFGNPYRNGGI
jgi:azurin